MFINKEQRDLLIAYKKTFGTVEGKAVLHDLMNQFYVLHGHGGDPISEGKREAVLHIMRKCKIKIEQFDKMLEGDGE